MSFRTDSGGLGVSYPTQVTNVGSASGTAEYHYYYQRDFQLGLDGLNAAKTTVAGWSDWTVLPHWQDGSLQFDHHHRTRPSVHLCDDGRRAGEAEFRCTRPPFGSVPETGLASKYMVTTSNT